MKELLVATRNIDKYGEIVKELEGVSFRIVSLADIRSVPPDFDFKEKSSTFEQNAIGKAKAYGERSGIVTLADDSGLCVDALGGRPGVLSARYAPGTSENRNSKLLVEMSSVPKDKRTARYVAVIAIYDPSSHLLKTCRGECEGLITSEPLGSNGFGYDPVFYSLDLGKTMAEASVDEKSSVSHRGKAFRKVREILVKDFS